MKQKHFLLLFSALFGLFYFIYSGIIQKEGYYVPSYHQVDLSLTLSKPVLETADYQLIYEQTGISKPIIDELKNTPDFIKKMLTFQKNYFSAQKVGSLSLNFFTTQEVIKDSYNLAAPGFNLAPYKNGYIFLTKSTYTMNWRHGHAGIVIDDKRGKTLEALSPGTFSMEQDTDKWRYYPTFKMMRPKAVSQTTLNAVAHFAGSSLRDLPYDIFADKNQGQRPYSTHCSLLIWQAYHAFGIDLDATGGLLVSPENIAKSPLLETMQIYGFNPNKDW